MYKRQFPDSLNDALSKKDMDSFWRKWRSKFTKSQLPGVIDGCCNEADIAHRFSEVFKAVCIPNSKDKNEQLHSVFDEWFLCYKGASTLTKFITVDLVQQCIEAFLEGLKKFSVEHLRSKFYRTFNCIYSTGWLKIKYPTGEYAISLQPVV